MFVGEVGVYVNFVYCKGVLYYLCCGGGFYLVFFWLDGYVGGVELGGGGVVEGFVMYVYWFE